VDRDFHTALAVGLCGRSRTADPGAARRFDGGDCGGGRIFLSEAGVIEFGCDCGVITIGGEAVGAGRFELSTFIFGDRVYRGIGIAVAGGDGAAVCPGAARMA